jgi:uncharacterized protein (DUF1697 family)
VALLRAVNLGGDSRIDTAAIRGRLERLGCREVRSVAQTGNFAFGSPAGTAPEIEARIEGDLARALGRSIEVLVRSGDEWRRIIEQNPFPDAARQDPSHLVVAVLKGRPSAAAWAALDGAPRGRERIHPADRHAYLVYPDGIGRSPLTSAVLERHLGVRSTMRNWNTVTRLADALPGSNGRPPPPRASDSGPTNK